MDWKKPSDYLAKGTSLIGAAISGIITRDIIAINNNLNNDHNSEFKNKFSEIAAGVTAAVVSGLVIYTGLNKIINYFKSKEAPAQVAAPAVEPAPAPAPVAAPAPAAAQVAAPEPENHPAPRYSLRGQIKTPKKFADLHEYNKYYKNQKKGHGQGQ
jgi:hypothetical protein